MTQLFCHESFYKSSNHYNPILRFNEETEEFLISKWLFDETKLLVIRLACRARNENFSKHFMSKLQMFSLPMPS